MPTGRCPRPSSPPSGCWRSSPSRPASRSATPWPSARPIEVIRAGTVHPGKYLVLVGGDVADVEEALEAGREIGGLSVRDEVFLPNIHPDVVAGTRGARCAAEAEALGIIETATIPAVIQAADAGLKGAAGAPARAAPRRRPRRQGLPALRRRRLRGRGRRRDRDWRASGASARAALAGHRPAPRRDGRRTSPPTRASRRGCGSSACSLRA